MSELLKTGYRLLRLLVFLCLFTPYGVAANELPSIGGSASISEQQEEQLANILTQQIRRNLPLVHDPILNDYIKTLGAKLTNHADDVRFPFRFFIVQDDSINAFALPGGIIVINTGLIEATHNESELASVVAHEIAHVTQRHIARRLDKEDDLSLATGLGLLAAILASSYNAELSQAALLSTVAASQQQSLGFSREFETEADREGIDILNRSGFDPYAMSRFFSILNRQFGGETQASKYLRTHPLTIDRLNDSQQLARLYESPGKIRNSNRYELIKARILGLMHKPSEIQPASNSFSAMGQIVALNNKGEHDAALNLLKQYKDDFPVDILVWTRSEILIDADQADKALQILKQHDLLYPHNNTTSYLLAKAYLQNQQAELAVNALRQQQALNPLSPTQLLLLAEAAHVARLPAIEHENMAEYHFLYGRKNEARKQLQLALQYDDIKEQERERLQALLDSLTPSSL